MARGGRSAEFKAGLVILIGIVILIVGYFLVKGGFEQFRARTEYTAFFKDGASVGKGDSVFLGGIKAGEVAKVDFVDRAKGGGPEQQWVAVTVSLYADRKVPIDCIFRIEKTITSIVTVKIDLGESKQLANAETVFWGVTPDTFEVVIAKAGGILDTANEGVKEFTALMKNARGKVDDLDTKRIQGKIEKILDEVDGAAMAVRAIVEGAKTPVDETLAKANRAAGNIEDVTGDVKKDWREKFSPHVDGILVEAKNAAKKAGDTADEVNAMVKENRPGIKSIVQNIDDASRRLGPVMARLESLTKNVDDTVVEARPELVRTLKNAKKAMANFESLTEDLKTAPWKLVNKPSGDETDAVHLYNASRLYVEAAGRIQNNIEDIDALRRLGVLGDPSKKELIERAIGLLKESLNDFEKKEKGLADAISKARK